MENPYKSLIQPMLQTKALDVFNQMQQQPKGLLGGTQTPLQAGLLGAAQAISPYMGYTTMPTSFGQAATAALGGLGAGLQQQRENQLTKSLAELSALSNIGDIYGGTTDGRTAKIKEYEFYQSLSPEKQKVYKELLRLDPDLAYQMSMAEKAGEQGMTTEMGVISPMQLAFDQKAAPILAEFQLNKYGAIQENLQKLNSAIKTLETQDVTGPVTGAIPKALQIFVNPEAIGVQEDIASITFQSLKEILGGQFTEEEGKRLIEQSFNPLLDEKVNLKRLKRQQERILKLAESKLRAIEYFNKNGTLKNFDGFIGTESKGDIEFNFYDGIFNESDYDGLNKDQIVSIYNDPNTSIYEKQFIESLAEQD
jgi:hypothetical protein